MTAWAPRTHGAAATLAPRSATGRRHLRPRRTGLGFAVALGVALALTAAPARTASAHGNEGEPVAPGIYRHEHPELGAHVVLAELDSPEVEVEVVGGDGAPVRPSEIAAADPARVVVQSGGPFRSADYLPTGLTVTAGVPWPGTADDTGTPVLAFARTGCGSMRPSDERTSLADWIDAAISGSRELLRDGQVAAGLDCADDLCDAAPRSAIGVGRSGHRLVLVVVDGPPGPGPGMTARALGELLAAHGAYAAVLLEGGASASLAIGGAPASSPSDGVERAVASVLALRSRPGADRYKIVGVAFGDTVGGNERVPYPTVELRTLSGFSLPDVQDVGDEGGYYETVPVLARSYQLVVGADGRDRTCLPTIDETGGIDDCGGTPCRWASVRLLPGPGDELGCTPIACGPPIEIEASAPCGDPDGGPGGGGGDGDGCGCRIGGGSREVSGGALVALGLALLGARRRARPRAAAARARCDTRA